MNATNYKAAEELIKCQGDLFDERSARNINTVEFTYTDATCEANIAAANPAITLLQPGKFIAGIDCCRIQLQH